MLTRRFYDIIERLQAGFEGERKFSIELLEALLNDFREETHLSGGRVWEKTPAGYRCIREVGTRTRLGDDYLFPLAQIPLEEMRKNRFIHLAKGDPLFDVPAQQAIEVESFTAFPVDDDLHYVISIYFERSEDFAAKRALIESFLRIVGLFTSSLAASKREGEILGEILELAHRQQTSILPEKVPVFPGFDIHGASEPYTVVGGDYFRFFDLFGPLLGVCVADVKGKGFSAAVQVTALHRVLAVLAQTNLKIAYKAYLMNQAFFDTHSIENLIALVYGELGPDGRFHYANMAHVYPLWYRHGADEFIELEEGGPFLGLQPDAAYGTGIVILEPGDLLVLYTDGITEIADDSGEEYGRSRLKSLIRDGRDLAAVELTERIFHESRAFSGSPGRVNDDRTVVVIRRLG